MTKTCNTCQVNQSLKNYYKNKNCAGGHLTECKYCNKIYQQQNSTHNVDMARARRRTAGIKPKKIFESEEERRIEHLKACKRWQQRNKQQVDEYNKQYRENNRDLCNARIDKWRKNNPHKVTEYIERRAGYIKDAKPKWADDKLIQEMYNKRDVLSEKHGIQYQVDHIVPILGKNVCGLHVEYNLQILTAEENNRKGNSFEN